MRRMGSEFGGRIRLTHRQGHESGHAVIDVGGSASRPRFGGNDRSGWPTVRGCYRAYRPVGRVRRAHAGSLPASTPPGRRCGWKQGLVRVARPHRPAIAAAASISSAWTTTPIDPSAWPNAEFCRLDRRWTCRVPARRRRRRGSTRPRPCRRRCPRSPTSGLTYTFQLRTGTSSTPTARRYRASRLSSFSVGKNGFQVPEGAIGRCFFFGPERRGRLGRREAHGGRTGATCRRAIETDDAANWHGDLPSSVPPDPDFLYRLALCHSRPSLRAGFGTGQGAEVAGPVSGPQAPIRPLRPIGDRERDPADSKPTVSAADPEVRPAATSTRVIWTSASIATDQVRDGRESGDSRLHDRRRYQAEEFVGWCGSN